MIRYVQVPAQMVDTELLQDAARREYAQAIRAKTSLSSSSAVGVAVSEKQ